MTISTKKGILATWVYRGNDAKSETLLLEKEYNIDYYPLTVPELLGFPIGLIYE